MIYGEYLISDDKSQIQPERVCELLSTTYWAGNRPREAILTAIDNSYCFGVYKDNEQVGFARCVTDYTVLFYVADVVIDEKHRGQGLGKALMQYITEHEIFAPLYGVLNTRDAHGLYQQYGFERDTESAMRRLAPVIE